MLSLAILLLGMLLLLLVNDLLLLPARLLHQAIARRRATRSAHNTHAHRPAQILITVIIQRWRLDSAS
jgi:hypothetical protein